MVRQEYTRAYLKEVLKSHGYNPPSLDGGYLQFAISLVIVEKLEQLKPKPKKKGSKAIAS